MFKNVENSSNGNPRWLPFFLHKLQRVIRRAFAFCSWCAVQKSKRKSEKNGEICQKRRSRAIQFCTAFHSLVLKLIQKIKHHNFSMHLYGALGFVRRRRRSLDSQSFSCKKCLVNHVLSLALVDFRPRRKKFLFKAASNWTKKCKKYRKRSHLW